MASVSLGSIPTGKNAAIPQWTGPDPTVVTPKPSSTPAWPLPSPSRSSSFWDSNGSIDTLRASHADPLSIAVALRSTRLTDGHLALRLRHGMLAPHTSSRPPPSRLRALQLPLLHQQSCRWRPDRFHLIRSPSTRSSFSPLPYPTTVPSKPLHPSSFASWFVSTTNARSTSSEPGSGSGTSSPGRRGYHDPSPAVPTVLAGLGHSTEPAWDISSYPWPTRPASQLHCSIRRPIGMATS